MASPYDRSVVQYALSYYAMKRTLITILVTFIITSLCWYIGTELRRGVEGLWLTSAVKAPGRMALEKIESDLNASRFEPAKAKLVALKKQWAAFERETGFHGQAIGNIMVTFGQIEPTTTDQELSVGMDFSRAVAVLNIHGAEPTFYEVMPDKDAYAKGVEFHFYQLHSGEVIELISEPADTGRKVHAIFISTYAPKSWTSKIDPERDKFLSSFKEIRDYSFR
jgi:hypothetical protein